MTQLLAVFLTAALLSGCATPYIILVQPGSGDFVQCSSTGSGIGAVMANSYVEGCVKQYEAIGFVQAENLTTEQKAKIPQDGKVTKNHQAFREGGLEWGGVSIGGSPSQGQLDQQLNMRCSMGGSVPNWSTGGCV